MQQQQTVLLFSVSSRNCFNTVLQETSFAQVVSQFTLQTQATKLIIFNLNLYSTISFEGRHQIGGKLHLTLHFMLITIFIFLSIYLIKSFHIFQKSQDGKERKEKITIERLNVYKEYAHYSCGLSHLSCQIAECTVIQFTPE